MARKVIKQTEEQEPNGSARKVVVAPSGLPGVRRYNKRVVAQMERGEAEVGDYVALQVIGYPNPLYGSNKDTERPCAYLHPKDLVNVPDGISAETAFEFLQKGLIRWATAADLADHDREEEIAYQRSSFGDSASSID